MKFDTHADAFFYVLAQVVVKGWEVLHFWAELMEDSRVEVSLGIVFPELLIVVTSVNTICTVREKRCLLGPVILQPRNLLVDISGGRGTCSKLLQIEVLKVATKSFCLLIRDNYRVITAL